MDKDTIKSKLIDNSKNLKIIADKVRDNNLGNGDKLDIFNEMKDDIAKLIEIKAKSNSKLAKTI